MKGETPGLLLSLTPIVVLIAMLALNINLFGEDATSGPNQIALIIADSVAVIIALLYGHKWTEIRRRIVLSISDAMPSILILLLIGSLAGTWMISGIVPTLVYYGLELINPKIFLLSAILISAIVSTSTGSSWSTIATIGVALLGIGTALGFNQAMVAGAIISGAYFGDKMSPLSDTTNLASAMAGTDIITHIKYMVYTTAPSFVIALIIFLVLGFTNTPATSGLGTTQMLEAINEIFYISPIVLIVPIILIIIIIIKTPPIPALFIGTILGAIAAVIFQPQLISELAKEEHSFLEAAYTIISRSMFGSLQISSDNPVVTELLSTSGMAGMLDTIWLVLTAMAFSGIMESAGMLVRIANSIVSFAKSTGSLVASTVVSSIFMNLTASEQYISIVVPGRMYADIYKKKGLKPEVLSRTLEDGGTVTSVLIPWNTGGAVQSSVLGVPTLMYAPYAFFNIISPIMTIAFAYLNIKIRRFSDDLKSS